MNFLTDVSKFEVIKGLQNNKHLIYCLWLANKIWLRRGKDLVTPSTSTPLLSPTSSPHIVLHTTILFKLVVQIFSEFSLLYKTTICICLDIASTIHSIMPQGVVCRPRTWLFITYDLFKWLWCHRRNCCYWQQSIFKALIRFWLIILVLILLKDTPTTKG